MEILGSRNPEPFLDPRLHCRMELDGLVPVSPRPTIRVVVVSEERLFREAVAVSLASYDGIAVLGDLEPAERVDVVLMDTAPDPQAALAQAWEARERWPEARLIALGLDREDDTVVDFIEAGAQGYVLQGVSPDGLVEVIRAVHQGRTPCSPAVVASVLARIATLGGMGSGPARRDVEPLTLREREVLALLAAGLGNKEVGRRLQITVQTVKNHVHRILEKLQVHRRREAVRLSYDLGLLAEPREIAVRGQRAAGREANGPFTGGVKA